MANVFTETFNNPGSYDNQPTFETGTISPAADPADVSSPPDWGVETFEVDGTGEARFSVPSTDDAWFTVDVIVEEFTGTNGQGYLFAGIAGPALANRVHLQVIHLSGEPTLRAIVYHDGSANNILGPPAKLGQLYRNEVKWDDFTDTWSWWVNGVQFGSGTLAGHGSGIEQLRIGHYNGVSDIAKTKIDFLHIDNQQFTQHSPVLQPAHFDFPGLTGHALEIADNVAISTLTGTTAVDLRAFVSAASYTPSVDSRSLIEKFAGGQNTFLFRIEQTTGIPTLWYSTNGTDAASIAGTVAVPQQDGLPIALRVVFEPDIAGVSRRATYYWKPWWLVAIGGLTDNSGWIVLEEVNAGGAISINDGGGPVSFGSRADVHDDFFEGGYYEAAMINHTTGEVVVHVVADDYTGGGSFVDRSAYQHTITVEGDDLVFSPTWNPGNYATISDHFTMVRALYHAAAFIEVGNDNPLANLGMTPEPLQLGGTSGAGDGDEPPHVEWQGQQTAYIPAGAAGNYLTTLDDPLLDQSDNLRARVHVRPLVQSVTEGLMGKYEPGGDERSWYLKKTASNFLQLQFSTDGTAGGLLSAQSQIEHTLGNDQEGYFEFDFVGGDVTFTQIIGGIATDLGTDTAHTGETIYVGTAPIRLGSGEQGNQNFEGHFFDAQMWDDGVLVYDANIIDATEPATGSFPDRASGLDVTWSRAATGRKTALVTQSAFMHDNASDYLTVLNLNADYAIDAGEPMTAAMVVVANDFSGSHVYVDTKGGFAASPAGWQMHDTLTDGSLRVGIADGTIDLEATVDAAMVAFQTHGIGMVRDKVADALTGYVDDIAGTPVTDTTTADLHSGGTDRFDIGRILNAADWADGLSIAKFFVLDALTDAEMATLLTEELPHFRASRAQGSLSVVEGIPEAIEPGSAATLTITVNDPDGNQVTRGGDLVRVVVTGRNPTTVIATDNLDGTYTAAYSPAAAGFDTLTVSVNGATVAGGARFVQVRLVGVQPAHVFFDGTPGNGLSIASHPDIEITSLDARFTMLSHDWLALGQADAQVIGKRATSTSFAFQVQDDGATGLRLQTNINGVWAAARAITQLTITDGTAYEFRTTYDENTGLVQYLVRVGFTVDPWLVVGEDAVSFSPGPILHTVSNSIDIGAQGSVLTTGPVTGGQLVSVQVDNGEGGQRVVDWHAEDYDEATGVFTDRARGVEVTQRGDSWVFRPAWDADLAPVAATAQQLMTAASGVGLYGGGANPEPDLTGNDNHAQYGASATPGQSDEPSAPVYQGVKGVTGFSEAGNWIQFTDTDAAFDPGAGEDLFFWAEIVIPATPAVTSVIMGHYAHPTTGYAMQVLNTGVMQILWADGTVNFSNTNISLSDFGEVGERVAIGFSIDIDDGNSGHVERWFRSYDRGETWELVDEDTKPTAVAGIGNNSSVWRIGNFGVGGLPEQILAAGVRFGNNRPDDPTAEPKTFEWFADDDVEPYTSTAPSRVGGLTGTYTYAASGQVLAVVDRPLWHFDDTAKHFVIPHSTALNPGSGDFTVLATIRVNTAGGGNSVSSKRATGGDFEGWEVDANVTAAEPTVDDGPAGSVSDQNTAGGNLANKTHVVGMRINRTANTVEGIRVVDGVFRVTAVAEDISGLTAIDGVVAMLIGKRDTDFFQGVIIDHATFGYALTGGQIAAYASEMERFKTVADTTTAAVAGWDHQTVAVGDFSQSLLPAGKRRNVTLQNADAANDVFLHFGGGQVMLNQGYRLEAGETLQLLEAEGDNTRDTIKATAEGTGAKVLVTVLN